jgi:hypothetical protein
MLQFSTELPTRVGVDVNDFMTAACEWLAGSPNHRWTLDDLSEPGLGELSKIERYQQEVQFGLLEFASERLGAFRFRWTERKSIEWTTELVARDTEEGLRVSVRVSADALSPGKKLPTAKKPYIIRRILEDLGGGEDGPFVVQDQPIKLRENDLATAVSVINGETQNQLPVVYVSVAIGDHPYVNVYQLAEWLSGTAHVVVEPNRSFSYHLRNKVDGRNAFGGAHCCPTNSSCERQRDLRVGRFGR